MTLDYLLFGDESGHAKDVDCIPDLAEFLSAQGAEVSAEANRAEAPGTIYPGLFAYGGSRAMSEALAVRVSLTLTNAEPTFATLLPRRVFLSANRH